MEVVSFTPLPFYAPVPSCVGSWVGARAGLDVAEKEKISFHYQELNPNSLIFQPVSDSLHRLTYPSSSIF
jgi:hypothetical protein